VDIGTTTLVVALVDLESGDELDVASALNPQTAYGHDVLSRIHFAAAPDGLATMQRALVDSLNVLIRQVCQRIGVKPGHIHEAVLGGNTCMLHIAAAVDPAPLGRAPYRPSLTGGSHLRAAELGLGIAAHGLVYLPPVVSGFVGADITAGILATDLHRSRQTVLLLRHRHQWRDGARPCWRAMGHVHGRGPGLRGREHRVRHARGAWGVDAVTASDGRWTLHTIGDVPAIGICRQRTHRSGELLGEEWCHRQERSL